MKINDIKDLNEKDNDLKIAWRYENINYTNLKEELSKSLKYILDLLIYFALFFVFLEFLKVLLRFEDLFYDHTKIAGGSQK